MCNRFYLVFFPVSFSAGLFSLCVFVSKMVTMYRGNSLCIFVSNFFCMCTYIYIYVCVCVSLYPWITMVFESWRYVCMYVCVYMYVYVCIYI
jgi:hypothetical protein